MLENVIVLKQVLEAATDTPSTNEPEPTLPAPETLGAQFKNRYQSTGMKRPYSFI